MLAIKMNQTEHSRAEDRNAFTKRIDSLKNMEEEAYTQYYELNRSAYEGV